jgi:hypothetical protein
MFHRSAGTRLSILAEAEHLLILDLRLSPRPRLINLLVLFGIKIFHCSSVRSGIARALLMLPAGAGVVVSHRKLTEAHLGT